MIKSTWKPQWRFQKSLLMKGFIVFYVAGILIFFTSRLWYPDDVSDYVQPTEMGRSVTFADRDFTLKRWEYSERQGLMEMELQMMNHSLDGIKKLYYEAADIKCGQLAVEVVHEESNLTVVRIRVPEKWSQVSFRVKLHEKDEAVLKYYTNREAVAKVGEIKDRTQEQYFEDRAEKDIENLKGQIAQGKEQIAKAEECIHTANENISELMAAKKYQTEEEQLATDRAIRKLEEEIAAYQGTIADLDRKVRDCEEKIGKFEEQISGYRKDREK